MFMLNSMKKQQRKSAKSVPVWAEVSVILKPQYKYVSIKDYIILMNRLCTLVLDGLKAPQGREVNEVSCQRAWLTCGQTVSGRWLASPETLTELTVGLTFRTPAPRNQLLSLTDVRITWLHWPFWGERKMTQQQQPPQQQQQQQQQNNKGVTFLTWFCG